MKKICIRPSIPSLSTDLYIGEDLLTSEQLLRFFNQCKGKKVIVADCAIKNLYAMKLSQQICAELITIQSGEHVKTQKTVEHLMDALFQMGAGKDTTLIALGGGVTTDLVGFVASIYMRGISLVLVPTTLIGLVDAAIGGKTAVNTPFGKNLIGTIYPPKAIWADLNILQTLPEKEQLNGLAEILKIGLIYDSSIWELAKHNGHMHTLILKAIQGKIAIIEQDPMEQALRRILNFGHTMGHALETVAHYEMPHGEAVALGCLVEGYLSMRLGYLSEKNFEKIQAIYHRFPLQLPKAYTRTKLLEAMAHDKKRAFGEIRFVLIDEIGHALPFEGAYCRAVIPHELESTLNWMENR